MKSFKEFIRENSPSRVFRVDPIDREDPWKQSHYAVLQHKDGSITGSAPLPDNHNVKPGDEHLGYTVARVENNTAFATPHSPNSVYGALSRNGGPNGTPVSGAAIYDEEKMWGKNRDPNYKGEVHMTQKDYDNIPEKVKVSSASGENWSTKDYSGMDEVSSNKPVQDAKSEIINTKDLLHKQYNVIIHPNTKSIQDHINKVQKESPHLSVLNQLS